MTVRLPDANKRVVWVALRYFVTLDEWYWSERPSVAEGQAAVLAVASGEWGKDRTADWPRPGPGGRSVTVPG